ncbi:MAG: hypothetical protein F9B45_13055 [Phycisphaera sp. RhM]|nr:hypothetical protein [Phycisphaera sp. RhM]
MLRGHIKSFALYSLATLLVASPVMAATPGDASRRAAARATSARESAPETTSPNANSPIRNALGLRPIGQQEPIRQVVGKQPTAPKVDPNRGLSLIPSLFGVNQRTAASNTSTQARPAPRTSNHQAVQSKGILSDIFGTRPGGTDNAARPVENPAPTVDWQGIPYHQARSKSPAKGPTPIRDPRPNETRFGGPSQLSTRSSTPSPTDATPRISPAIPQPPALAAAPTSRRTAPAQTASSRVQRDDDAALSILSSSRRSGRRDVPTLDASEIAAAQKTNAANKTLVPKVAKRDVPTEATPKPQPKPQPKLQPATTKPALAKTETKPVTPAPAPIEPTRQPTPPKKTPAADVALNPQPKSQPATQPAPLPTPIATLPESDKNGTGTGAAPAAPSQESEARIAAAPQQSAPKTAPTAPAEVAAATQPEPSVPTPFADAPMPAQPAPTDIASTPATEAAPALTAPAAKPEPSTLTTPDRPTPAAELAATPQPQPVPLTPTQSAPTQPATTQPAAPTMPVPAAPQFGPTGSVAGHRIGPPASSFRPRPQPQPHAALNPAHLPFGPAAAPIGSGVTSAPTAAAPTTSPTTQTTIPIAPMTVQPYAPTQPISQNPYIYGHYPYPTPPQQNTAPYGTAQHNAAPHGTAQRSAAPIAAPQPTPVPQRTAVPQPTAVPQLAQQPAISVGPDRHDAPTFAPSQTRPGGSHLGAPMASMPAPYAKPVAAPPQPAPQQPAPPQPAPQQPAPPAASAVATDQSFQAPTQPRPTASDAAANQLLAGQTAVASELPGLRVVTHGPSSVIIRQTHEFEIRVENRGSIDAEGLMIRAVVPDWADIKGQSTTRGDIDSQDLEAGDRLVWTLDTLPAGKTEKLFLRLQARQSGTHRLDVDWTLTPQTSVATVHVREPLLDLLIEGPEEVVYGESQTYKVRVLNPGDGLAPNVVFTLSPNSSTPQTQRIGDIPSGKEAQFEVELTAQDLGDLKIHGLAAGDLGLKAQAEKTIQVSAAELEAVLAGPEAKYQNTEAIYHLQISNKGKATCKNVTASLGLPPGIHYQGGIDVARKQGTKLIWEIESLPPGASRDYEFSCTMVSPGKQTFDFTANGSAAGKTAVALDTQVESIADLVMTLQDPAAPAPVGSEVVYEIVIKNRGSRQANGVRAIAQFSNGIEPRRIEGHSGQVLTGQVLLDPIETIRPGEEIRIRVIAEAESEGHHRFRTEIRSGETVLVAEEATQFLSKRGERVSRRSSSSSR